MNNPRLNIRYAQSIFDLALERNELEIVRENMKWIASVCNENPDLVAMLNSPVINSDKKLAVFQRLFVPELDKLTMGFVEIVIVEHSDQLPRLCLSVPNFGPHMTMSAKAVKRKCPRAHGHARRHGDGLEYIDEINTISFTVFHDAAVGAAQIRLDCTSFKRLFASQQMVGDGNRLIPVSRHG